MYVIRASNMELLFADGGVSQDTEDLRFQELGTTPPGDKNTENSPIRSLLLVREVASYSLLNSV